MPIPIDASLMTVICTSDQAALTSVLDALRWYVRAGEDLSIKVDGGSS